MLFTTFWDRNPPFSSQSKPLFQFQLLSVEWYAAAAVTIPHLAKRTCTWELLPGNSPVF